jgi:hypothetical protein
MGSVRLLPNDCPMIGRCERRLESLYRAELAQMHRRAIDSAIGDRGWRQLRPLFSTTRAQRAGALKGAIARADLRPRAVLLRA